jgi:hypothetical protein
VIRPSAAKAYVGVLTEAVLAGASRSTLIVESGILGGDLIPRAYIATTLKQIRSKLDGIAAETGDSIDLRMVGSGKFGAENRAVFGDLDLVLRMEKPETLSRIHQWVADNALNVRDITNKTHGKDLDIAKLGGQFSFLFPIHTDGGEPLTIGELRVALQTRHGQTNWKDHHDERLRVQSNLTNLDKKSGLAMVQVDIMHALIDGAEAAGLVKRAKALASRINQMQLDNKAELSEWLEKTVNGEAADDFESHYDFLRQHGEMQNDQDQQILAAIYFLKDKDSHKQHLNNRWSNLNYRYSFHPDALQIIYFLAAQVGIPIDHDSFSKETLTKIVQRAVQAGVASDKLTVDMLHQPAEAYATLKGKFKDAAKHHIVANTKNKRADEHNPDALWKNLGTREVKRI